MTVQSLPILSADDTSDAFRALISLKRAPAIFVDLGFRHGTGLGLLRGVGWGAATVCREDHAGHGHLPTTVSE